MSVCLPVCFSISEVCVTNILLAWRKSVFLDVYPTGRITARPSSPPLWQAPKAAKHIHLNRFVSLNKREWSSLFLLLLLFPSPFSLFVPFNLVFVSRTGETPKDFLQKTVCFGILQ